jgi:hypothetical protein
VVEASGARKGRPLRGPFLFDALHYPINSPFVNLYWGFYGKLMVSKR